MQTTVLALTGFVTGLGLIIAIGAQNAFVLRQGIRRERVAVVVAVCTVVDIVLIAVGTAGIGAVFAHAPWLIAILRWCGVAYLLWFALQSVRSAFSGDALTAKVPPGSAAAPSVRAPWRIGLLTASLSLLNPHVYLDTVVMVGTVANQQEAKWVFAGGAMVASLVWFAALGWGAHRLAPLLRTPRAWMVIDLGVAVVMAFIAAKLAFAF